MEEEIELKNKKARALTITILSFLVFIICFVISIYLLTNYITDKNANYVEEYATVTRYEKVKRGRNYSYTLYYEYIAPDGTEYTGIYLDRIMNFDFVEDKIGFKFKIYVAHELQRHRLDLDFDFTNIIVFAIAAVAILVIFIAFLQHYFLIVKQIKQQNLIKV